MPTYEFQTEHGEMLEEFFPMREAPSADGEWLEIQGKRCQRVISQAQARVLDHRHVSHSLPRKGSGIETVWDKFTPEGKPYFEGRKDIIDFEARSTYKQGQA